MGRRRLSGRVIALLFHRATFGARMRGVRRACARRTPRACAPNAARWRCIEIGASFHCDCGKRAALWDYIDGGGVKPSLNKTQKTYRC